MSQFNKKIPATQNTNNSVVTRTRILFSLDFTRYLTNKQASTVVCTAVKHAGSGRTRKKCREKHEKQSNNLIG